MLMTKANILKPLTNDGYDDGNIPDVDLPQKNDSSEVKPDDVPRQDGPGGE